jgi:TetR/AcrR family transcriptional repressor of nem operon
MRVSREKAAENRKRIIDAAGTLFRARGFAGVGVADIMKAAELTHGGFYGHFASKDDLAAQASRRSLVRAAAKWERIAAASPLKAYAALLANYLTPTHRDDPARGCAFASLSNDAARGGKAVRAGFAEGLQPFLGVLAESIRGRSKEARRRKAIATMAALVGAVTLARAVGNPNDSDEILAAVHLEAVGN